MPRALVVPPGTRFGRLTILREVERHRRSSGVSLRVFAVLCDCGVEKTVTLTSLRGGTTVSCGCFHVHFAKTVLSKAPVTHGASKTRLYDAWSAMKQRCHNPSNASYWRYGARGISVCEEWRNDFAAFAAYVGERPPGLTLDRIDPTGNYEPGNVRWADYKQQARNTRRNVWLEVDGERITLAEAVERFGWVYGTANTAVNRYGEYKGVRRVQP